MSLVLLLAAEVIGRRSLTSIPSGKSLAQAGPAPLFIGYTLVGFLCFLVMAALGEVCNVPSPLRRPAFCRTVPLIIDMQMAAWLPLPSGFTGYATRFVVSLFLSYCSLFREGRERKVFQGLS